MAIHAAITPGFACRTTGAGRCTVRCQAGVPFRLRELPASGAHAPGTREAHARAVKDWAEFVAVHGVGLSGSRDRLKAGLSRYAEHRAAGPAEARFAATTWGRHMSILSSFYRWAIAQGHAESEPFTYRSARALFAGTRREVRANLAVGRTPKPHVTVKYMEPEFTELFRNALRGLAPDGSPGLRHSLPGLEAEAD
jgi:Phage integrase, N-terminal SAM-like domain